MNAVRRVLGRTLRVGILVGVVVVGLVAQAGAYLFGFTTPAPAGDLALAAYEGLDHAAPGPRSVGVRHVEGDDVPVEMTVWYPAADADADADDADDDPAMTYSYGLTVLGPQTSTALATYAGRARLGATPDRADGPHPLVVLSAGFAISPGSYAWLAEHLASHGMVVVAAQHGETLNPSTLWRAAIDRPAVVAATRTWVAAAARPGGELAGLVDPETVAVLGHSYGGYTALAAGGAALDAEAFAAGCAGARDVDDPVVFLCDALEPRFDEVVAARTTTPEPVDAVVSLAGDAAMFGEAGLASITAPLLAIGGTADHDSPYAWSTQLAFDGAASDRKAEVALEGAGHFVFSGECGSARRIVDLVPMGFCDDPAWERERARAVIRHYVTAFLLAELAGSGPAARALGDHAPSAGVGYRATGYR